jgi:hypothetical protein
MIDWLVLLGIILSIFVFLLVIVYYDIIPRIFGESCVEVEGYPIRRVKDKIGFYRLQKRYFPGIWMDISRCDIIVPITSELPSYVTWRIDTDYKYKRKFIEFKPTFDEEVALKFEQLLIKLYKDEPLIYKERVTKADQTTDKYKPFIPGGEKRNLE